jgi:serine O-acetyltransferase
MSAYKDIILADAAVYIREYKIKSPEDNIGLWQVLQVLLYCTEFRNLFYTRISPVSSKLHIASIIELILPRLKFLAIGTATQNIGRGLYIEHGYSTFINVKKIGDYCWINQNVTLGDSGKGIPEVGNNVKIGTGAVVVGPIKIGNNVIIGANATVVKDLPDNCTVVPSSSYIIKMAGERVKIQL